MLKIVLCLALSIFITDTLLAQNVRDYAVEPTATVSTTPPAITLRWKALTVQTPTVLYLKRRLWQLSAAHDSEWITLGPAPASSTSFTDTNVVVGQPYEYSVSRDYGIAVTSAAINLAWSEKRGEVLLLVDSTVQSAISSELNSLISDLALDGYGVNLVAIPRSIVAPETTGSAVGPARRAEIDQVRTQIQRWFSNMQGKPGTRSAFIIGHVAVPYCGNSAVDGHADHQGAWSCDLYYSRMADVQAGSPIWTDTITSYSGTPSRTQNIPGDGKLDQSGINDGGEYGKLDVLVGRIDFSRISISGVSETDLLRQYLTRNHRYRYRTAGFTDLLPRTVIDDNFGYFNGEMYASMAWNSSSAVFGSSSGLAADFFNSGLTSNHFVTYGCGGGSFTSCAGVAQSGSFVSQNVRSPFLSLFGSYFGDWDNSNGLLLSAIAGSANSLALGVYWGNRPNADFSAMALGAPFASATFRAPMNHKGYLGDPTLRLQFIAPPATVSAQRNGNQVELSWSASRTPDIIGYHVLAGDSILGPFTRISGTAVSVSNPDGSPSIQTTFIDASPQAASRSVYAVLAVKRIESGSATYFDASQAMPAVVAGGSAQSPSAPASLRIAG